MFEFFRRKPDSNAEGESEASPEDAPDSSETGDSEVKDAVEAMLREQAEASAEMQIPDLEADVELDAAAKSEPEPDPGPKFESEPIAKPKLGDSVNVIGSDTKITGDMSTKNPVLVLGEIEGDVEAESVTVEADGAIRGDVKTKNDVIVRGTIFGALVVEGKLTITSSGSVTGGVQAKAIAIEEGGELRGRCSMAAGSSSLSVVSA